jgi:hypothetical protein
MSNHKIKQNKKKDLQMNINEGGFEILSPALISVSAVDIAVQVLVTTQYHNLRKLDPELHCKRTKKNTHHIKTLISINSICILF